SFCFNSSFSWFFSNFGLFFAILAAISAAAAELRAAIEATFCMPPDVNTPLTLLKVSVLETVTKAS
ncbi:hypothetical protein PENTCL1PPCAC_8151, partial [Pristionchus entomophagus]